MQPDLDTWQSVIEGFLCVGNLRKAEELLGEMEIRVQGSAAPLEPYNSLISHILKSTPGEELTREERTKTILKRMAERGTNPNKVRDFCFSVL